MIAEKFSDAGESIVVRTHGMRGTQQRSQIF
jgi:hypothetical protein